MTKRITEETCEMLYERYGTPPHVIAHCKAVSHVAEIIARHLNEHGFHMDLALVKGAGLAHDVARVQDRHWDAGAEILENLGYSDEAAIVRVHMNFDFHPFEKLNETDMVCLGDRLVKEDRYVGLDERIEYILAKAPEDPEVRKRILRKKADTKVLMEKIEDTIGQSIDSLFV